jgi:hypothetical protein
VSENVEASAFYKAFKHSFVYVGNAKKKVLKARKEPILSFGNDLADKSSADIFDGKEAKTDTAVFNCEIREGTVYVGRKNFDI